MGQLWSRNEKPRPGRTSPCSECAHADTSDDVTTYCRFEELSLDGGSKALAVKDVDLDVNTNTKNHHTDDYEIAEDRRDGGKTVPAQLLVRRGETFDLKVTFNRPYDKDEDVVKVVLEIGEKPLVSKGTRVALLMNQGLRAGKWSACSNSKQNDTTITVLPPADCIVGMWRLSLETIQKNSARVHRYRHKQPIYVLFNAWCKEDQVYMEDDVLRDEYVLNDVGKQYVGTSKQLGQRPWNYGQFEDDILDCVLYLLDANMGYSRRGSAIHVTRAISAFMNAPDDNGVLVGNWSGDYKGGDSPSKWVGSVRILKKYWRTRESVKFGQCWVFSGLATTVCRALGIPCRSITTFDAAHDSDGTATIDTHYDARGKHMVNLDGDWVWNFHVWNEVWMARPDLEPGYGGWQAFDSTPGVTSSGIYVNGPASIRAIKEGDVNAQYDTTFLFASVNADKVTWQQQLDGEFDVRYVRKKAVGKKISTKKPRKLTAETDGASSGWSLAEDAPDRLDITEHYKYPEGSEEERAAVHRAKVNSRRADEFDPGVTDVEFEFEGRDGVMVGEDFNLLFKVKNTSSEERNVFLQMALSTIHYTGIHKADVKTIQKNLRLGPNKSDEVTMDVTSEEYLKHVVDQVSFKVRIVGQVEETKQCHFEDDNFRLRRPDLVLEAPSTVHVNETFDCVIKLHNTMPLTLTDCSWSVESPRLLKPLDLPEKDLDPHERVEVKVTLTARKKGLRTVMASFDSKELQDISGEVNISVVD